MFGPQRYRVRSVRWMIFFVILSLAFSAFIAVSVLRDYRHFRQAQAWPSTSGLVIQSSIQPVRVKYGQKYAPVIRYSYTVDDKAYLGNRIQFGSTRLSDLPQAQKRAAAYPKASQVTLYYDPEHPEQSVLDRSEFAGSLLMPLVLPGIFTLIGVLVCAAVISRTRQVG